MVQVLLAFDTSAFSDAEVNDLLDLADALFKQHCLVECAGETFNQVVLKPSRKDLT